MDASAVAAWVTGAAAAQRSQHSQQALLHTGQAERPGARNRARQCVQAAASWPRHHRSSTGAQQEQTAALTLLRYYLQRVQAHHSSAWAGWPRLRACLPLARWRALQLVQLLVQESQPQPAVQCTLSALQYTKTLPVTSAVCVHVLWQRVLRGAVCRLRVRWRAGKAPSLSEQGYGAPWLACCAGC